MTPTAFQNILKSTPKLATTKVDPRTITVADALLAGPLPYVDESGSYTATLQLGAQRCWRSYRGGKWAHDESNDPPARDGAPRKVAMRHVAAVHELPAFSGRIINGLISEHNEYIKKAASPTRERQTEVGAENYTLPGATVGHQLLISNIRAVDALPNDGPEAAKLHREQQMMATLERIASALEGGA